MIVPVAKEWCFNLGGVNVSFEPENSLLSLVSSPRYAGFLSALPPDLTLHLRAGRLPLPLGLPAFEAGHWNYYHTASAEVFRMRIASPGPHFTIYTAFLQPDGRGGDLFIEDEQPAPGQRFSYEIPPMALDEVLAVHWITRQGGLILHACGLVEIGGAGLLFSGRSGTGKSTTARLWLQTGQAHLLSDERVSVFQRENTYWLQGTPWHGEGLAPSCATAPLQRLFIITHAPQNEARRMLPSQAVQALLELALLPFWDQQGLALALDFLSGLCQSVPCYTLGFVPDRRVVEYVQCLND